MTIDLSFTNDKKWLEHRGLLWEKIKVSYSSELTRDQREVYHRYFLNGTLPEKNEEMYAYAYILLFPLQNYQGIDYCFKHYVKVRNEDVDQFLRAILSSYSKSRAEIEYESAIFMFNLFYGEKYESPVKFPFMINGEQENRIVEISAPELLHQFIDILSAWIKQAEIESNPIHASLLTYFFSLFKNIPEQKLHFVVPLTPAANVDYDHKREINDTISWCKRTHEFLKLIAAKKVISASDAIRANKMDWVSRVYRKLDEMTAPEYPQTLIDHWQWVKEGKKLRNTPPPVKV